MTEYSTSDRNGHEIGGRLRLLRNARRMTIGDLSEAAGVSAGIISQIERGKSNPSMKTVHRIKDALGVTLWALLDDVSKGATSGEPEFVRRAASRPRIVVGRHRIEKRLLSPNADQGLKFMLITMPPNSETDDVLIAPGDKGGLVLTGQVEVTVGDRSATLMKGDSFQFRSDQPHQITNRTDVVAELIWIMNTEPPAL